MDKRVTLVPWVVAVLISSQAITAAADTGFTSNDFKAKHVVADIGATATVTVQGLIDRDFYAAQPLFNVHPSFDLQQSCQNLSDATVTITATATIKLAVCPIPEHGRRARGARRSLPRLDRHRVLRFCPRPQHDH